MRHGKQASIPHVARSQHGLVEHDRRSQCGVTPTGTRDSGGGQDRVAHRSSALPRVGPSQDGVRLHPRVQALPLPRNLRRSVRLLSLWERPQIHHVSTCRQAMYERVALRASLVRFQQVFRNNAKATCVLNRSTDEVARNGRFEDAHILTASIHASLALFTLTSSSCESFSLHR